MRSITFSILFFALLLAINTQFAEAGWFKSKTPVSDKLSAAERASREKSAETKQNAKKWKRDAKYKSDVAKAKAEKQKAEIKENAKRTKKQAQETSQEAVEKSAGWYRSFRNKMGAMFH